MHDPIFQLREPQFGCQLAFPSTLSCSHEWLFDLDVAIRRITQDLPDHPSMVQLTGVYNNLICRWADV